MIRLIPVALILMLGTGCFLSKHEDTGTWTTDQVAGIEVGKSTTADVLQVLGPPTEIIKLIESDAYVYRRSVAKETGAYFVFVATFRSDVKYDAITVILDRKGVVTGVGARFNGGSTSYGLPGMD